MAGAVDAESRRLDAVDCSDHRGAKRLTGREARHQGVSGGRQAIRHAAAAGEGQAPMTTNDFREHCIVLINQLLAQGFERPIALAAIASDGLTTAGSSETITGTVLSEVKTTAPPDSFARYLLPIHILFVDAQGRVAHGVISHSGAASVRILP
jgi:hypothetical protein